MKRHQPLTETEKVYGIEAAQLARHYTGARAYMLKLKAKATNPKWQPAHYEARAIHQLFRASQRRQESR